MVYKELVQVVLHKKLARLTCFLVQVFFLLRVTCME